MISKDLQDSYLNISGKFFPLSTYGGPREISTIEQFLYPEQAYSTYSRVAANMQYSWFTIIPDSRVREQSRLNLPTNCDRLRQNFAGLRAGLLYEDKLLRWLGIDNYHVGASVKNYRTITDVEHFRSG